MFSGSEVLLLQHVTASRDMRITEIRFKVQLTTFPGIVHHS